MRSFVMMRENEIMLDVGGSFVGVVVVVEGLFSSSLVFASSDVGCCY